MASAIFLKKLRDLPLVVKCSTDFVTYPAIDEFIFLTTNTKENLGSVRITEDGLIVQVSELGKKHEFGVLKIDQYEHLSMN